MDDVVLDDIVSRIFERWGSNARPTLNEEHVGKLLAISIGLGTIFNENPIPERIWMQSQHPVLKTRPITAVLAGMYDDVLNLVNQARGLD